METRSRVQNPVLVIGLVVLAVAAVLLVLLRPWESAKNEEWAREVAQCAMAKAIQETNEAYTPEQVEAEYQACLDAAEG